MPVWTSTDPPAELNETPVSKLTGPELVDLVKDPSLLNEPAALRPLFEGAVGFGQDVPRLLKAAPSSISTLLAPDQVAVLPAG